MTARSAALWNSPWPAEDGGPRRVQVPGSPGLGLRDGEQLVATSRLSIASTMVVLRDPGEVYLLCHTGGDDAVSWVERIDPVTLESVTRSVDLPGGRTWPGGLAVHADGDLYVAFGRHVHRLSPALELMASREMPRDRPYNSFVVLPDGHLVTKDFAGDTPFPPAIDPSVPSRLAVLAPGTLEVVTERDLPEPSVARLSASGDDVYVVGVDSLLRYRWDGVSLSDEPTLTAPYRTRDGQSFGWDAVVADGAAWFMDQGAGSERYAGSFVGLGAHGGNVGPVHLVRVDLKSGAVSTTPVGDGPAGLIANPPAVDIQRGIVVGYDSSAAVVVAFDVDAEGVTAERWRRPLAHACHPLLFPDTGEIVLCDHDGARNAEQLVVLDIETGDERGRVDTGSPVQSPLFMAPGWDRDIYACTFTTVSRVTVA